MLFFSCQTVEQDPMLAEISTMEKNAETDPNVKKELLSKYSAFLTTNYNDKAKILPICRKGADLAMDMKQYGAAANFQSILLREQDTEDDLKKRALDLSEVMAKRKKMHSVNVIKAGYMERYPDDEMNAKLKAELPVDMPDVRSYLDTLGAQIFVNPDKIGINENAARNYVDACETFAMILPDHEDTPTLLFKAAELAKTVRTFPKTMSLYDWIIEKYPNYENAGLSMFLKAFIMENEFKRFDEAKEVYLAFIAKYPDHKFVDDAQFSLENIGKSGEEIMQIIEARRKAAEAKNKEAQ